MTKIKKLFLCISLFLAFPFFAIADNTVLNGWDVPLSGMDNFDTSTSIYWNSSIDYTKYGFKIYPNLEGLEPWGGVSFAICYDSENSVDKTNIVYFDIVKDTGSAPPAVWSSSFDGNDVEDCFLNEGVTSASDAVNFTWSTMYVDTEGFIPASDDYYGLIHVIGDSDSVYRLAVLGSLNVPDRDGKMWISGGTYYWNASAPAFTVYDNTFEMPADLSPLTFSVGYNLFDVEYNTTVDDIAVIYDNHVMSVDVDYFLDLDDFTSSTILNPEYIEIRHILSNDSGDSENMILSYISIDDTVAGAGVATIDIDLLSSYASTTFYIDIRANYANGVNLFDYNNNNRPFEGSSVVQRLVIDNDIVGGSSDVLVIKDGVTGDNIPVFGTDMSTMSLDLEVCDTFDVGCQMSNIIKKLFVPQSIEEGVFTEFIAFATSTKPISYLYAVRSSFTDLSVATSTLDFSYEYMGDTIVIVDSDWFSDYTFLPLMRTFFGNIFVLLTGLVIWKKIIKLFSANA